MAQSLMRIVRVALARYATALVAVVVSTSAVAEVFSDPTRPPAAFIQAAAPASTAATGTPAAGPVLQSVMISPQRSVATINGQAVVVGDKVGDATVARIGETEVVLRSGKSLQTLKLFPTIDKREGLGKTIMKPAGIDRKE